MCCIHIPAPSVSGGIFGKAEKGGKGCKAGIEGKDDIAGIDGTDGIDGNGVTGVTGEVEAVDIWTRVEGKECIAGIGIGGIIVPITGRTGTAKKIYKKNKHNNYYFVSDQSNKEYILKK